jgi:RNA polymerase sigma-70 factor, ECF subfamily
MTLTDLPNSQTTSPSLLGRATSGEPQAWQRMVQIYGPLVYSWARRTGLQPQDAADVTQETFAAVSNRLQGYDAQRPGATFRGWLWTITRNKAADLVRNQQAQPGARGGSTNMANLNAVHAKPTAAIELNADYPQETASDQQEIVRRALAILRTSFEATTWQAFWRTVIDGCSPDDVAAELSLSRWAVYKARSRVLQRLRSELDGLEDLS